MSLSLLRPMAATNHKMIMLFFFFLLLQVCCQLAFAHSAVNFLPGFQGPLPFELETGYVDVGDSEEVQLFYYFIKSERKPEEDPLLLWLTGGPGCSALSGLVFEIGPLKFEVAEYNGSLPTLVLNPYSWTKVSNIIFVDSPVGTGFSYVRNKDAEQTSDTKQAGHLHQFLLKWLKDHANFISNPFYLSGDSYSGILLPVLGQEILNGNERGVEPIINLQGYILGNPKTVESLEENFKIPYAHGMGLISDELYESLERNCNAEYLHVDPCNQACLKDIQNFEQCTSRITHAHILEPCCGMDFPEPGDPEPEDPELYLNDHCQQFLPFPPLFCRIYAYYLCRFWANDDNVRKALHIRKGSIGTWKRCNRKLLYNKDVPTSFPYHANLSTRGYRALIYSGDHDMLVPYLSTQEWIRLLCYSIVDDWRPWMVQGQVAGSVWILFADIQGLILTG